MLNSIWRQTECTTSQLAPLKVKAEFPRRPRLIIGSNISARRSRGKSLMAKVETLLRDSSRRLALDSRVGWCHELHWRHYGIRGTLLVTKHNKAQPPVRAVAVAAGTLGGGGVISGARKLSALGVAPPPSSRPQPAQTGNPLLPSRAL